MERKYALSKSDFRLMKLIMNSSETYLLRSLPAVLEHYYDKNKIIITENYIYVLGDIPVALVAHLDTVHRFPPTDFFHDREQQTIWSPQGLGADDRAGVFAILKIIETGYRPSVIFTTKEESGGIGASKFIGDFYQPKTTTNFMIELDRCGKKDAVFYDLLVPEFQEYIEKFGFKTAWGTFSDISIIAPAWRIPAVNLSIGYENEHSLGEYLNYQIMYKTIKRVKQILDAEIAESHIFPFAVRPWSYWSALPIQDQGTFICNGCGEPYKEEQLIKVEEDEYIFYFCPECLNIFVDWCEECHSPYIKDMDSAYNDKKLCYKCEMNKIKMKG